MIIFAVVAPFGTRSTPDNAVDAWQNSGPHRGCLPDLPWTIYVVGKSRFEIHNWQRFSLFDRAFSHAVFPSHDTQYRKTMAVDVPGSAARLSHREETKHTHIYTHSLSGTSARLWDDYCLR